MKVVSNRKFNVTLNFIIDKWYFYLLIQSLKTELREGKQELKITEAKYRLFLSNFFDSKGYHLTLRAQVHKICGPCGIQFFLFLFW